MILFTGGGKIASVFQKKYESKIVSSRNLNDDELSDAIKNAQTIIHNSALIYSSNFDDFIESNFLLTRRVIKICKKVNPKVRFINLSSMSILSGDDTYLPVDQMNDYAYSKYISENYCLRSGLENLTNLRFSTIFYGDSKRDGISKLIEDSNIHNEITLLNKGIAKRDIIPLRILVEYLYKICKSNSLKSKYNIVSGKETSFKEISDILKENNRKLKIFNKALETQNILCSFSKKDVIELGEIHFDLRKDIEIYMNTY